MNLHDIKSPMAHIDTISAYCQMYYGFTFRVADDRRSIEYQTYAGEHWQHMPERDTLTYTNAALEWNRRGRPNQPQ